MKKRIVTRSPECYKALTNLKLVDEVIIPKKFQRQISMLLSNLNSKSEKVVKENLGEYILLRKINYLDADFYIKR